MKVFARKQTRDFGGPQGNAAAGDPHFRALRHSRRSRHAKSGDEGFASVMREAARGLGAAGQNKRPQRLKDPRAIIPKYSY
jgi:hypothetical protein